MPPGPARVRSSPEQIEALLADLGPRVRRGGGLPRPPPPLYASGLPALDALLGGGFPGGGLSEIAGPPCSGRTSVALSLLARATRTPPAIDDGGRSPVRAQRRAAPVGIAAWIDRADAFDPASAEAAGVTLAKVLWLRAGGIREALRCAERLLETEGIRLIVLDLASPLFATRNTRDEDSIPPAAWIRLARRIAGTPALLLALSDRSRIGSQAEVALAMNPIRAHFGRIPAFFEQLEVCAVLVRHRTETARLQMRARLHLGLSTLGSSTLGAVTAGGEKDEGEDGVAAGDGECRGCGEHVAGGSPAA